MTELELLRQQVDELLAWKRSKELQQITYPLDLASKTSLGVPFGEGAGSTTLTETLNLTGNIQQIDVPAPYVQSFILVVGGVRYEIPSLI